MIALVPVAAAGLALFIDGDLVMVPSCLTVTADMVLTSFFVVVHHNDSNPGFWLWNVALAVYGLFHNLK